MDARWIHALRARWRALTGRNQDTLDIEDELKFHLAMSSREKRRRGVSRDEADRLAKVDLGGLTQTRERARGVRPFRLIDGIAADLRHTVRALRRAPGFLLISVATIGLAIATCTAMYSVVYGVVLQPLPYPSPDRIVRIWQLNQQGDRGNFSEPNFTDLRARATSFAAVALYSQSATPVVVGDEPLRAMVGTVSQDYFRVFAVGPAFGRLFTAAELAEGAPLAAVVSHRLWQRHFAGRSLHDAALRFGSEKVDIVGVMPAAFDFPAGAEIWVPKERSAPNPYRTGHNWNVVARLRDDQALPAARAESTTVARQLKAELGDSTWMADVAIVPLADALVSQVKPILLMLLGAVALLLIVASASLANLLLVRALGRERELAIRAALGAARSRLFTPIAAEAALIGLIGGGVGIGLAAAAIQAVAAVTWLDVPRLSEVTLSWPVLVFAAAVTAATSVVLSLIVSWRVRQPAVTAWLKNATKTPAGGRSLRQVRQAIVVVQLAVSVVLLVGGGLLARSLARLLDQNLGFRTDGVLAVQMSVPGPDARITPKGLAFSDPASLPRQVELNTRAMERLGALPGVNGVGGINAFPLNGASSNGAFFIIRGDEPAGPDQLLLEDPSRTGHAEFRVASAGYFSVMGIPLVRGRLFDDRNDRVGAHQAVVSESLARRRWPDGDPIGARIQFGGMDGDMTPFTIVGVVGDIRERGYDGEALAMFYADYRQRPLPTFNFTVTLRTSVEPASIVPGARRVLAELAPDMPPRFRTVREAIDATTVSRRFTLGLTAFFAGAALLLALLGIYGVLSYLVEQRRHEFGVRMALGARPRDVSTLVMREAARLVACGVTIGVVASLLLTQGLKGMLFGVPPSDAVTYVVVITTLGLCALVAGQIPAVAATRVSPVRALHDE
jgi:putative ABC transport system permease protein